MFINDNTKNQLREKFKTKKIKRGKSRRNYLSETIKNSDKTDVTMSYLLKQQTKNTKIQEKQLDNFNIEKHKYSYPIEKHLEKDITNIEFNEQTITLKSSTEERLKAAEQV